MPLFFKASLDCSVSFIKYSKKKKKFHINIMEIPEINTSSTDAERDEIAIEFVVGYKNNSRCYISPHYSFLQSPRRLVR